VNRGRQRMKI